jgi:poly-beta-hydroxybutyrate-responsive repressor
MREMLIPYVLLAVSMQRAHGYWIEEYLRGLGFLNLEMSTLYRTLRQLEKDGLLHSGWEPGPSGPARRVYFLTEAGQTWLDTWAHALVGYREMIDRFFGLYAPPRRREAPTPEDRTGDSTDR